MKTTSTDLFTRQWENADKTKKEATPNVKSSKTITQSSILEHNPLKNIYVFTKPHQKYLSMEGTEPQCIARTTDKADNVQILRKLFMGKILE